MLTNVEVCVCISISLQVPAGMTKHRKINSFHEVRIILWFFLIKDFISCTWYICQVQWGHLKTCIKHSTTVLISTIYSNISFVFWFLIKCVHNSPWHFLALVLCCTLAQVSRFSCNPDETSAKAWGFWCSLDTQTASELEDFRNYTAQRSISISNNSSVFSLLFFFGIQRQVLLLNKCWQS